MAERRANSGASTFEHTLLISSAPTRVMGAFFDPEALSIWWQTARSVTTPRPLGIYAVEWEPSPDPDEILGRLGGVFYGTVMEYLPGRELFVADAWWLPPDGEPLGPMSLEVSCMMDGPACRLRVRQSGFEDGERWRRYFGVIERGWISSLASLKSYIEALSLG
jgi:uncharacterized protein YndB with AHSA1/START domain